MNEKAFTEVVQRLQAVNKAIKDLDPSIRGEAFAILRPYVSDASYEARNGDSGNGGKNGGSGAVDDVDAERFFEEHSSDKIADNAYAITAYHYSRYGAAPITLDEVRELAAEHGLTIPDRIEATISTATRNKKKLFRRIGQAQYKPTTQGESFLKSTFNVKKGRQSRGDES